MDEIRFKKLAVWKDAKKLAVDIYDITKSYPDYEKYGLCSQMQRAAVSVSSNIAEGSGRNTNKEFVLFLSHSRGSLYELLNQIEISYDIGLISREKRDLLEKDIIILSKRINAFITKLKKR